MYQLKNYFKKTDYFLWGLVLLSTGFGIVVLYAIQQSFHRGGLKSHVGATIIGLIAMIIISIIDYRRLVSLWKLHSVLTYGLVLSLFIFGTGVDGSDNVSWLPIPVIGGTIQPTEFLKISFILTYAAHIAYVGDEINKPSKLILLLLHGLAPVLLIHKLGDDGVALIFLAIMAAMLVAGGLRWYYVIIGGVGAIGAFALAWKLDLISQFQKERFMVVIDESRVSTDMALQQNKSIIAMGSGGMFGDGLFGVNHMFVPVVQNDFVISFIGQALGFVGTLTVVVLLSTIMIRILSIAMKSITTEGKVICAGVFGMMAFQTIINIGMCIKVVPVIGITLPFFSQGGSSMLSILAAMGLCLSVTMHNEKKTLRFTKYT